MLNANLHPKFLEEYKKNFSPIVEIDEPSFLLTEKRLDNESFKTTEFLIFSIIYNSIYFLFQIIFFATEKEKSTLFGVTIGLFVSYITFWLGYYILNLRGIIKLYSNSLTFLSYSYIYVDIFIVSIISYFSKEIPENNGFVIYVYDFNLIMSGCLMILSCEFKFKLRYKIIVGYLIAILGLIIFRAFLAKNFIMLIYSISMTVFFTYISFYLKKRKNVLKKECTGNFTDTQNVFDHLNSITKGLNVGIFIFRKDELFFANEIGRNIIDTIPIRPLNQIAIDGDLIINEIRPNTDDVNLKVSIADSKLNNDQSQIGFSLPDPIRKDYIDLCQTKEARLLFENVVLFEDFSKFSEKINKFNSNRAFTDSERKLEANISLKNISCNKEKRLNLSSFFSYLTKAEKSFLSDIKDYLKLGIFELQLASGKKAYFKINAKMNSLSYASGLRVIEFIFEDVTLHYNLLNTIEENDLNFKKNVHEFKTPILSMLGCAEELKFQLSLKEKIFSKNEMININNSLDHMTSLSSFIGYQIKGLISKKEINSPSNLTEDHKQIELNSLLNFCLNILKTLLGCDSQKLKNIQAVLNNDINDYDVAFISDEIQVKQILLNFISNSVKFTNQGRITIGAKLKKINQNDSLQIIIKDTGCGVKKEDNSQLFNEYAKFNNTQNNQFGTGLGLNICKSMAENLNLKIEFKSEENKGTEVTLCILNPKINEKEKLIELDKIWIINNNLAISRQDFPIKSSTDRLKLSTQTFIQKEPEINFKLKTVKAQRKKAFRSLPYRSLKVVNREESIQCRRDITKKYPTMDIDPTKVNFFFMTCLNNNRQKLSLQNQEILLNDCNELNIKEINAMESNFSSRCSFRNRTSQTKRSSLAEKILIVDDQLHARRSMVFIINKFCKDHDINYEIIEESDGIDCLGTIIKNPSSIKYLFIDENMNYMNGTETAQIIRKLSNSGKIAKINIISTSADDNMINFQDLFDHCVAKPVRRDNLKEIFNPR